jgi:HemY protein
MLRAVLIFAALAALAAGAAWIAGRPGALTLEWGDLRIETSVAVALGLLGLLVFLVLTLHRLWLWFLAGPGQWRASRANARRRRGYDALTRGLVAVAAGDGREASREARRASELLEQPPLARLLTAQAAQLEGDEAAAAREYDALIETSDAEFLGLRGRLALARRAGDRVQARTIAERAFALRPQAQWVAEELFQLQAADGDWEAAERTLAKLDGGGGGRRRALTLFGRARAADARGEERAALDFARKAHGLAPELAPITVFAARLHAAGGEAKKARKLLEDGWARAPHPELVEAWRALDDGAPDALARLNPEHPESRLLLAEEALRKGERDEARRQLEALIAAEPDARAFRLLADLAERDRDPAAVARWLRRAAEAPRPAWRCRACGALAAQWRDHCPACGAFDSLDWGMEQAPPALPPAQEPAAQLLPPDVPARAILKQDEGEPA